MRLVEIPAVCRYINPVKFTDCMDQFKDLLEAADPAKQLGRKPTWPLIAV